ncbi:unnamed protein product [Triticum turgidum subsp. durum]|uniref:Uncharacterized protein n=2 Tax=Triticum TaxID=4564 RepID=A0A9R1AV71_TRITD|nr:unnamed protein product [Triticum turgidum subsp. durum]
MSQLSLPRTPSSSAPASREPWPPSSSGSPASAYRVPISRSDIARLASLSRYSFRYRSIVSKLQYYMPLFGSFENLLRALKRNFYLHSADLDDVVKPNVALLRECGLGACDIAKLCISQPWLLAANPERVQAMVECAENIGVPRAFRMFRHALHAVAFLSEDKIAARVKYLKNTFRWTDAEVGMAVSKYPTVLNRTKEFLQRRSEFLISDLGLEPAYIAHHPLMLAYSLEGRLRPRYYVVTFLKENGLLDHGRDYYYAVKMTEKVFMEKFICPHKDAAPYLAEDYVAACRGKLPARFRFT